MEDLKKLVYMPFVLTFSLIGLAYSWAAIVDLIVNGIPYTVADWLNSLLETYRITFESIWNVLDPPARYTIQYLNNFLSILGIELHLNPWWKSFWTPQFFYASMVALAAWTKHRSRSFQIFCLIVGLPIFFASSVAASSWPLDSHSIWPMVIIGVGFAGFHLFVDLWFDRIVIGPGVRPVAFKYLLIAYPLANLGIVLVIALASILVVRPNGMFLPVVVQVLLAVALMGARDVAGGFIGATFLKRSGSWWSAFLGYATTAHGLSLLAVLAAAAATVTIAVQQSAQSL